MRELVLATGNKGKIPGLKMGLGEVPFNVLTLEDIQLPEGFSVEEPGTTYEAHAVIKAFMVAKHSGFLTLADDSGLEIEALGGEPGVHTATYFSGNREEQLRQLLEKMKDVPDGRRRAQYRCVIALYDPHTDKVRFAEGVTKGSITRDLRGMNGFGFDPVFLSDDLSKTFGECSLAEVSSVSHRGRALAKAREILLAEFFIENTGTGNSIKNRYNPLV